jgi:NCS1 family nucleobase:cation symporter-1
LQYYVISRGHLEVPDLFTSSKNGLYYYYHGWNIRAYVAYGEFLTFWPHGALGVICC